MNMHHEFNQMLPEYAAGTLDQDQLKLVETHLKDCKICQADLAFWQTVTKAATDQKSAVKAPIQILNNSLFQVRAQKTKPDILHHGWSLIRSQIPMVRREIWPASAAIMIIGYIAAILVGKEVIIQVLAPLVAAASIAMIFGPANDPAGELMVSLPTSPRQILLARLSIVFGYNFALALAASILLLPVFPYLVLPTLIISWLAPMTFISALALFLSIHYGAENAIIAAYGVWIMKYAFMGIFSVNLIKPGSSLLNVLDGYSQFWQHPAWMFGVGILLLAGAVWSAGRVEYRCLDLA